MEHIKKLYGKAYHLYNIEDWKYIFSILKEKDKYNHTEEEFLAAELIDKTAMMKMMDENISKYGWSTAIDEHVKPLVDSCPEDEGCKVIQDFLEDEDVKDRNEINHSGGIPACNPENSCEIIQDFLEEDGLDKFSIFRSTQTEYYDEIYQCQNRIESYKKKIRAEVQDIQIYRQRLDEAFNQYIE